MVKSCLNCKHCVNNGICYTTHEYYGLRCEKKRRYFDYNLFQFIKGMLCIFYEKKEVRKYE